LRNACSNSDSIPACVPAWNHVLVGNVRFSALSEDECVNAICISLDCGQGGFVVTPNVDHLRRARRSPAYLRLISQADLVTADGMPVVWAARLQGTPLPGRVPGSELFLSLARAAAVNGRRIFLLGGNPGAADAAARELARRFAGLRVAGVYCPPYGFEDDAEEMDLIVRTVRDGHPDIVFVGLGSPKQELLIEAIRGQFPGVWWLGIGVSFSFVAGEISRAPRWMQRLGLEWTFRLSKEPRRLARRYLIDDLPYAIWLMGRSTARRLRQGRPTSHAR
jgi:N-acetylglucosaminyldiphosphoundecaprenol N-acetyl-beta-D-mannosaminyltransferase